MAAPKCFISYSWDNDEHKDWVRCLATELQRNGVETRLDQWDTHPGMDVTNYMETCIRESDFVLLVCTPIFAQKANAGIGGVGYEKGVVTGEIFADAHSTKKFVPVLRKGNPRDSLPSYLKSRVYIDFRDDNMFESSLKDLLRHLHQSPKYVTPPLGSKPDLPAHGKGNPTVEQLLKFVSGYGSPEKPQSIEEIQGDFQLAGLSTILNSYLSCDPTPKILDIGCGNGALMAKLADIKAFENYPELEYVGFDRPDRLNSAFEAANKLRILQHVKLSYYVTAHE